MKTIAGLLAIAVIAINMYFVVVYIQTVPPLWYIYLIVALGVAFYLTFVVYLVSKKICTHCYLISTQIYHDAIVI